MKTLSLTLQRWIALNQISAKPLLHFFASLSLGVITLFCTATVDAATAAVSAGYAHTVALKSDGTMLAWGKNSGGQLGNNSTADSLVPVSVSGISSVVAVSAGLYHTAALKSDGTLLAWGKNFGGQLGNNSTVDSLVPVPVSGISSVVTVSAGFSHTVALKSDGTVWTWGRNLSGELGNNSTVDSLVPVPVSGLSNVVAVSAGSGHTVALKSDGTVWAWGNNLSGELGNNSTAWSLVPVPVSGLSSVVAVSANSTHTVALKSDGTVWAWGRNDYGQLGNGSTVLSRVPVPVSGLSSVVAVSAGIYHTVALKSDGTLLAWGNNFGGQLGNNCSGESHVPVPVFGLGGMVAVSAGIYHTVALKSDGTLWDWGYNSNGQLGNNSTALGCVPVQVVGPDGQGFLNLGQSSISSFVPPEVLQTPSAPKHASLSAYFAYLNDHPLPEPQKNILIVTHGWNGTAVDQWVEELVWSICNKLGTTASKEWPDVNGPPVWSCSTSDWVVSSADWSAEASNFLKPWEAYTAAGNLGDGLGDAMANTGFDHIHFIAHSAGSNLIQHATQRIKKRCDLGMGAANCANVSITETFLDAFAPLREAELYGYRASYAEHYVDTLTVTLYGIDSTNITLPRVFNFDVTALDPYSHDLNLNPFYLKELWTQRHGWPYEFYKFSVPGTYKYGFPISVANGGDSQNNRSVYPPSFRCPITDAKTTICEVGVPNSKAHMVIPPTTVVHPLGIITKKSQASPTGVVSTAGPIGGDAPMPAVILTTGSPAWISVQFQVGEQVEMLDFDYSFSSNAQGLLSVYLDNELIFRTEELHALPSINASGPLPFKIDSTAPHVLSFRLDPMSDAQSSVEISNIRPSSLQLSSITNRPPIANAGPDRILRATSPAGASAMLDGSKSSDPDRDSLTFTWTGPFGTVTEPKPMVTLPLGTNIITLTVDDGNNGMATSTVTIKVPILGDIDLDGDVDTDDLAKITSALNTNANGPNDLRDVDGDGKITALDSRKLVTLCTRLRCATR